MLIAADIRQQVKRVIEADPAIKNGLQRRIINSRTPARYILEASGVDSTLDALKSFRQTLRPKRPSAIPAILPKSSSYFHAKQKAKTIIAKVSTELALSDVNLIGIICNCPEDILLVTEAYAAKALEVLQRIMGEEAMNLKPKACLFKNSSPELETGINLTIPHLIIWNRMHSQSALGRYPFLG